MRFIFVRPARDYLRVTPVRGVIDEVPGPVFDVNGWDVRKALQLLAKGNATLLEWMSSPVVYRQEDQFVKRLREVAAAVYQPVRSFHHYYAMGRGNYREYLQGEQVRAKKYLYVLRPLLAAKWVLERTDAPPMAFECLARELVDEPAVLEDIDELLALKRRSGEQEWLPARPIRNAFLDCLLQDLSQAEPSVGEPPMHLLDDLLAETVMSLEPVDTGSLQVVDLRLAQQLAAAPPPAMRECCMWCGHTRPSTDRSWFERWLERSNDPDLGSRCCADGKPAARDWRDSWRAPAGIADLGSCASSQPSTVMASEGTRAEPSAACRSRVGEATPTPSAFTNATPPRAP